MTEPKMLKVIEPSGVETKTVNRVLSIATVDGSVDLILGTIQFSTEFGENGRSDPEIIVCARLRMSFENAALLQAALKSQIEMAAVSTEKPN